MAAFVTLWIFAVFTLLTLVVFGAIQFFHKVRDGHRLTSDERKRRTRDAKYSRFLGGIH